MTRVGLAMALMLVVPCALVAQTIHGHPQKAFYASPAEWPLVSSQGHWSITEPDGMMMLAHTHVECWAPLWAETGPTLTISCRIQLFHVSGYVGEVYGNLIQSVVMDSPSPIVGDPNGVVIRTMSVTFDVSRSWHLDGNMYDIPDHGWWEAGVTARTHFTDGSQTDVQLLMPFFSVINTSAPIPVWAQNPGPLSARVVAQSPLSEQSGFGVHVSEYSSVFPPILAPLNAPVTMKVGTYAYGLSANMPALGTFKMIRDLDLHNGVPGVTLASSASHGGDPNGDTVTFDPATLGAGDHKIAIIWDQQTGAGNAQFAPNQEVTSLLVVTVTVGDGVPTPTPTCQDPAATNIGGALPCTFPEVPQPTWAAFTPTFQRLGDVVRICAPDGKCLVLGMVMP